jgi:hypothetical protein
MFGRPQTGPIPVRKHPLYRRWSFMRQVCYNQRHADYKSYGAKGVKIGDEFTEFWDFADLIEHRLGPAPNGRLSKLARIDQDGDYTIKNLKWDAAKQVGRRHSSTHKLKYKGRTMSLRDWSEQTGINFHTLLGRKQRGWTSAQILGYKLGPRSEYIKKKYEKQQRVANGRRNSTDVK